MTQMRADFHRPNPNTQHRENAEYLYVFIRCCSIGCETNKTHENKGVFREKTLVAKQLLQDLFVYPFPP